MIKKSKIDEFFGVKVFKKPEFTETNSSFIISYHKKNLPKITFEQDAISKCKNIGTVKGFHMQKNPFSQAKLISVNKGKILDVFVDFRKRSRTYLRYGEIILSSINRKSVFLPKGFAHGYMTLDANTEISYKINNSYKPDHELTLLWNDKDLKLKWPIFKKYYLSKKDLDGLELKDFLNNLNK
ncbi:dTDP-4-dehydrorhamnose 3,5-epimerase family protein [Gammaproteobacteria bacterium]|nr:dTDP-4-dehydrorhamnose 3,5-epimerase family protein [Gammaproteobacteria bacterium]